jgi:phage terminase large subunit GpA-like protein
VTLSHVDTLSDSRDLVGQWKLLGRWAVPWTEQASEAQHLKSNFTDSLDIRRWRMSKRGRNVDALDCYLYLVIS